MPIALTVTSDSEHGSIQVEGPIDEPFVAYAMLGLARVVAQQAAVSRHDRQTVRVNVSGENGRTIGGDIVIGESKPSTTLTIVMDDDQRRVQVDGPLDDPFSVLAMIELARDLVMHRAMQRMMDAQRRADAKRVIVPPDLTNLRKIKPN